MLTLVVFAAIASFFVCWTIGANDVANAMGTSVGSKALTFRRAILVGAVFEFLGAVLVGSKVTETISKGIIDVSTLHDSQELTLAMIATLLSTGFFLFLVSRFGIPVSTTHAVVGSVAGAGIALGGVSVIAWKVLGTIALSWLISPVFGGILAYIVLRLIKTQIIYRDDADHRMYLATPYLLAMVTFVLVLSIVLKGLKNLNLDLSFGDATLLAGILALVVGALAYAFLSFKKKNGNGEKPGINVLRTFGYLQILTAAYVAFAHGANDVANGIGPLAAVVNAYQSGSVAKSVGVPFWILILGGSGIVLGLAMYGKRVMQTIGKGITEITPMRGFAAEFAAATVVLVASKMGMPISTTHTIVGAIVGVGLARREKEVLDKKLLSKTVLTWIVQIPIVAIVSALIFLLLRAVV
jgi:PiT family inorganic phosphate transporter